MDWNVVLIISAEVSVLVAWFLYIQIHFMKKDIRSLEEKTRVLESQMMDIEILGKPRRRS